MAAEKPLYTEDSIRSLDWKEHIRLRPGMYIGKLGDGSAQDDGIYVLVKEIIDNSIDEHMMGNGKQIDIVCDDEFTIDRSLNSTRFNQASGYKAAGWPELIQVMEASR